MLYIYIYMYASDMFPRKFSNKRPSRRNESTSDAEGPGSSAIKVARASPVAVLASSRRRHCWPDIHMQQPEEISSLVNKKSSYHPGTLSLSLKGSLEAGVERAWLPRYRMICCESPSFSPRSGDASLPTNPMNTPVSCVRARRHHFPAL